MIRTCVAGRPHTLVGLSSEDCVRRRYAWLRFQRRGHDPVFVIGAAAGSALSGVLGFDPAFAAALGIVRSGGAANTRWQLWLSALRLSAPASARSRRWWQASRMVSGHRSINETQLLGQPKTPAFIVDPSETVRTPTGCAWRNPGKGLFWIRSRSGSWATLTRASDSNSAAVAKARPVAAAPVVSYRLAGEASVQRRSGDQLHVLRGGHACDRIACMHGPWPRRMGAPNPREGMAVPQYGLWLERMNFRVFLHAVVGADEPVEGSSYQASGRVVVELSGRPGPPTTRT